MFARHGRNLNGESPKCALIVGNTQPNSKGVRREAESEGSCRQTSGLTDRNHIRGMIDRVRLQAKLKPNNYPKVYCVNVADRWRERLRTLTGEICT